MTVAAGWPTPKRGVDEAAVIRACTVDRSIVRTWAMRGTLHLVAAEDVGWLGLDDALCRSALPAIEATLYQAGPLTGRPAAAARPSGGGPSATRRAPRLRD